MSNSDPTLDEMLQKHGGFVHALALRLAPVPGLAEDIAQQAFMEFLAKSEQWDLSTDIRPLLAGITRNVARRSWRERGRDLPEVVRALANHIRELAESHEVTWFDEEEKTALRQCLERLPAKSRRLITLHYDLQNTSVEIARQMDMNADAVRRALFRLRNQLRKCVQRSLRKRPA